MKPLRTELHLRTAALEKRPIVVFCGAELIGSGVIEKITDHAVMIRNKAKPEQTEYYLRNNCVFYAL